jgi:hypothetical protein
MLQAAPDSLILPSTTTSSKFSSKNGKQQQRHHKHQHQQQYYYGQASSNNAHNNTSVWGGGGGGAVPFDFKGTSSTDTNPFAFPLDFMAAGAGMPGANPFAGFMGQSMPGQQQQQAMPSSALNALMGLGGFETQTAPCNQPASSSPMDQLAKMFAQQQQSPPQQQQSPPQQQQPPHQSPLPGSLLSLLQPLPNTVTPQQPP